MYGTGSHEIDSFLERLPEKLDRPIRDRLKETLSKRAPLAAQRAELVEAKNIALYNGEPPDGKMTKAIGDSDAQISELDTLIAEIAKREPFETRQKLAEAEPIVAANDAAEDAKVKEAVNAEIAAMAALQEAAQKTLRVKADCDGRRLRLCVPRSREGASKMFA